MVYKHTFSQTYARTLGIKEATRYGQGEKSNLAEVLETIWTQDVLLMTENIFHNLPITYYGQLEGKESSSVITANHRVPDREIFFDSC